LKVDLVDAHFALYAIVPLLISGLRRKPLVVHFQGPWADENVAIGDASWWREGAVGVWNGCVSRAQLLVTLTGAFRARPRGAYGVRPWTTAVSAREWTSRDSRLGDARCSCALGIPRTRCVSAGVRRSCREWAWMFSSGPGRKEIAATRPRGC